MKIKHTFLKSDFLIVILILIPLWVISRDAPITAIGSVPISQGNAVTMPLIVNNFTNIESITLRMDYNPQLMTYSSFTNINSAFSDVIINDVTVSATLHKIIFVWSIIAPITLSNGSKLVDLNFTYLSGSPDLVFNNTANGGSDCEYADENGDPLNDLPTSTYYIDGSVSLAVGKTLNLNLYLEGLFNTGTGQMNKAKDYASGIIDKYQGSVADHITVELHEATAYSTIVYQIPDIDLNQDGTATVIIPDQYTNNYFITVRHRNHIETVSSTSISFVGSTISYDFTTSASKAYGNNQKLLAIGKYGFYTGDINLDGFVNGTDLSSVNFAVLQLAKGYVLNDTNGDGLVNGTDLSLVNFAVLQLVKKKTP